METENYNFTFEGITHEYKLIETEGNVKEGYIYLLSPLILTSAENGNEQTTIKYTPVYEFILSNPEDPNIRNKCKETLCNDIRKNPSSFFKLN
jgi:hypothetical protein